MANTKLHINNHLLSCDKKFLTQKGSILVLTTLLLSVNLNDLFLFLLLGIQSKLVVIQLDST